MPKNPRDAFRGHPRSSNLVPFNMLGMVCAIVTLSIRRAVFRNFIILFDLKNVVTLESGLEVTQGQIRILSLNKLNIVSEYH